MPDDKIVTKQLQLERVFPENLQTHFVSNLVIQHDPESFTLSFFETWSPLLTGTPEEMQQQFDAIDKIEAKCVARMVLTPSKMRQFVQAMSENLSNYENLMREQTEQHKE